MFTKIWLVTYLAKVKEFEVPTDYKDFHTVICFQRCTFGI